MRRRVRLRGRRNLRRTPSPLAVTPLHSLTPGHPCHCAATWGPSTRPWWSSAESSARGSSSTLTSSRRGCRPPDGSSAAWAFGGVVALAGALAFAELAALVPIGRRRIRLPARGLPSGRRIPLRLGLARDDPGRRTAARSRSRSPSTCCASSALPEATRGRSPSPPSFVVALVNVAGVKPGSRLLERLVLLKVAALAVLIVGGLLLVGRRRCGRIRARPTVPRPSASVLAFGAALVPILFSYGGWQSANALAEEIREPRRTLPRALFAGTVIVLVRLRARQRRLPRGPRPRRPRLDRRPGRRCGPAPLRSRRRETGSRRPSPSRRSGFST